MRFCKSVPVVATIIVAVVVAACGGGGNSSDSPAGSGSSDSGQGSGSATGASLVFKSPKDLFAYTGTLKGKVVRVSGYAVPPDGLVSENPLKVVTTLAGIVHCDASPFPVADMGKQVTIQGKVVENLKLDGTPVVILNLGGIQSVQLDDCGLVK